MCEGTPIDIVFDDNVLDKINKVVEITGFTLDKVIEYMIAGNIIDDALKEIRK